MSKATKKNSFSLIPQNLDEAIKFAEIISKSTVIPKPYQGRPGDILVAVQMGTDLGLKPVQALQYIAVINGRPCVWGDALMAIVQAHPAFEDIQEFIKDGVATCTIKRKGQTPHTVTFSIDDAKKAGLWGKPGPWSTYPNRMLQMRARGFAIRDKFADALGGVITAEEAQDYPKISNVVNEQDNVKPELLEANSGKDELVEKLLQLSLNQKIEEGVRRMCGRLGITSIMEMTEEQLEKALHWAEEKQDEE
ncbi:MAG: hypothetical protein J0H68_04825 [Sphingobacteriia bacterium]|nr:hypothetical protein [Sphingobacteriia bacterium]